MVMSGIENLAAPAGLPVPLLSTMLFGDKRCGSYPSNSKVCSNPTWTAIVAENISYSLLMVQ